VILSGTTEEMMRSLYVRPHRGSIYEPATIQDIPQEVLEESLVYLLPSIEDLVAASEACRAWRPVAQKLIHSRAMIDFVRVESLVCGYRLNSLVFGSSSFQISTLIVELCQIGKEYITLIAQIVAPTLSSLNLAFYGSNVYGYETLTTFFSQCQWIRNLRLDQGRFGNDADVITPTIKDGFSRLNQLDLINCYGDHIGDVRLFIENTPIPNLKSFVVVSSHTPREHNNDIVDAAVTNFGRSLINLNLSGCYVSSANLVRIAENCRELEKLTLLIILDISSLSDMEIIASLPQLKYLKIGQYCRFAEGAMIALTRCRGLNHLGMCWRDGMRDVLRVIGRNLISLKLWDIYLESIDAVVEYCPNLQYLELLVEDDDAEVREAVEQKLKDGLKRLAKLKVYGVAVRLGTDWVGYWCE
jgi:hypothetical protein